MYTKCFMYFTLQEANKDNMEPRKEGIQKQEQDGVAGEVPK